MRTMIRLGHGLMCFALVVAIAGCGRQETATTDESAEGETPSAVVDPAADDVDELEVVEMTTVESEPPAEEEPLAETEPASSKVLLGSPELTAGIPGDGPLTEEQIAAWLDDSKNHEELEIELPLGLHAGLAQVKGLDENPLTRAKIELGRQLYFDKRLSSDFTISCADCHHPDEGYTRHTQFGIGVGGQTGDRNSPVSYNRILSDAQFWDGRAESLEEQAVGPIANPIEMANDHDACVECLQGIPGYAQQFDKIFGELTIDTVGQAIASFERAIVTGPTPFDYYEQWQVYNNLDPEDLENDPELKAAYEAAKRGFEENPMTESAQRGRELFFSERVGCSACHVGPNLTDEKYWHVGVGLEVDEPDMGRISPTGETGTGEDGFKTPTIRNVASSAPYMHDGSMETLEEVVEHYNKGGISAPEHAEKVQPHLSSRIKPLNLTDQEKADLVEFMVQGCSGSFPIVEQGRLPQ